MKRKAPYWIGRRPSDGKRWQGMQQATLLDRNSYFGALAGMYRRYAKQWNDIELDHTRELSEHTHSVCGARVVGSHDGFILTFDEDRENGWILVLKFARGFHKYYPGLSTGLNALRSDKDIGHAALHWRGNGQLAFDSWLKRERRENLRNGEWTEYKK